MSRVKQRDTLPEREVRNLVRELGFRYRLNVATLPGKPDLVFRAKRKVIFVHGCFWHRHQGCRFATTPKTRVAYWTEKFENTRRRDRRAIAHLRKAGWQSMVIWTCQLKHPHKLMHRIGDFLQDDVGNREGLRAGYRNNGACRNA